MSAKTASSTQFQNVAARAGLAALLFVCASAWAQVAPNLGAALSGFTVLGRNIAPTIGTVTCTGIGSIFGQVGTTFAGGITNAGPPCVITGPIVTPVGAGVTGAFDTAFANIDLQNPVCTGVIPIVSTILPPGVYCSVAGTTITGPGVILTLNGTASDVWVFRVGTGGLGALTLTDAQVVMGGTANACNVYWKTAQGFTTTRTPFVGTVLAGAGATMTDGSWTGRMLATTDATLTRPAPLTGCAALASGTSQVPTLSAWAMILLAGLLAVAGFAVMRRQR